MQGLDVWTLACFSVRERLVWNRSDADQWASVWLYARDEDRNRQRSLLLTASAIPSMQTRLEMGSEGGAERLERSRHAERSPAPAANPDQTSIAASRTSGIPRNIQHQKFCRNSGRTTNQSFTSTLSAGYPLLCALTTMAPATATVC